MTLVLLHVNILNDVMSMSSVGKDGYFINEMKMMKEVCAFNF